MARENAYLNEKQIVQLKDLLMSEKENILNDRKDVENYSLDKNELADPLDEASVNIQTSQELRFRNRKMFYLKKINKALRKVEEGIYGLCQDCDVEIGFERLMARPTADLCIGCKEESEMNERNNFHMKRSKSLGQSLQDLSK
ncbi:MAG: hypothetical protein COW01_03290 [Bdellovibrionales bacterium CG12_big_fil_rev_8_21_14_0_65_38_15]|nr:MAG: hypothetical protein COW79_12530 [Bdellovibrionales bacterium CG22_combo_CG10-13_8_21_14_all_38_13]PIQ56869.1 MAG: hypothetical protein COW01_03290 [Bdellovibrionales bacterium CG12_big_fil_rev_8_21_14_0_65_38_15]PIR30034.1 MAG: hypothetical protein COV38_07010 [Bdellovibrionales bacterium CG11_big_fil_rev_8_21_14_0_20_38_13]